MTWDTIDLDIDDDSDVATITVDRPEQLNALTVDTLEAIEEALADAEAAGARALVRRRGAGDEAFVAGADISYMVELSTPEAQAYAELGHRVADAIESFPAPTVAAIDGYAFGGGSELALACDLRVAAESAVIGQTEIDLGIIPGWGGTQRLSRLVGDETAKRLVFPRRADRRERGGPTSVSSARSSPTTRSTTGSTSCRGSWPRSPRSRCARRRRRSTPPATGRRPAGSPWSAGRGPDCSAPTTSARGWRRSWRSGSPTSSNGVAPSSSVLPHPSPRAIGVHGAGQSPRFINPPEYRRHGPVAAVAPRRADNRERRVPVLRPPDQ